MKTGQCSKLLTIEMISVLIAESIMVSVSEPTISVSESTVSILVETVQDRVRYDLELANRRRGAMSRCIVLSLPVLFTFFFFFYYPCCFFFERTFTYSSAEFHHWLFYPTQNGRLK